MNGRILRPYLVALFGALFGAVFTVLGHHIAASFDDSRSPPPVCDTKQFAYMIFLHQLGHGNNSALLKVFGLGRRIHHLATDSEIQDFENQARQILDENHLDFHWQFLAATEILRIANRGVLSPVLDDIEKAILLQGDQIDWSRYRGHVGENAKRLEQNEENLAYGFDEALKPFERSMLAWTGILHQELLARIEAEVNDRRPGKGTNCTLARS